MTTASLRRPIYGPRGRKTTFARRSLLREVSVDAEVGSYESLRAGDIRFPYHRTGMGGLPIILLHGWPPTSHVWRRVAPLLSSECDIVTPDLSGFGYTSKPDAGFDKKTIARRLRDFVRALGLSRVALADHDLGGHVAYASAAQWPEEVSHLIFIKSSLPSFGQKEALDVSKGGSWHFGFNMTGDISEELVSRTGEAIRRALRILFEDEDITHLPIHVRARLSK